MHKRLRDLGLLGPEWDVSIPSLSYRVQGPMQKRKQKDCKIWRWRMTLRKWCLPDTTGQVHTWNHKTYTSSSHSKSQHTPTLAKKPFPNNSCWERGHQFSSKTRHWVSQPHSLEGLMFTGSWPKNWTPCFLVAFYFCVFFLSFFLFFKERTQS